MNETAVSREDTRKSLKKPPLLEKLRQSVADVFVTVCIVFSLEWMMLFARNWERQLLEQLKQ